MARSSTPIEGECQLCKAKWTVPVGVDSTMVRCPNTDAAWHGVLMETYSRINGSRVVLETSATILLKQRDALNDSLKAIEGEAQKIAEALGG